MKKLALSEFMLGVVCAIRGTETGNAKSANLKPGDATVAGVIMAANQTGLSTVETMLGIEVCKKDGWFTEDRTGMLPVLVLTDKGRELADSIFAKIAENEGAGITPGKVPNAPDPAIGEGKPEKPPMPLSQALAVYRNHKYATQTDFVIGLFDGPDKASNYRRGVDLIRNHVEPLMTGWLLKACHECDACKSVEHFLDACAAIVSALIKLQETAEKAETEGNHG